jgi:hypothetical protein
VPRARGFATEFGELFRLRKSSEALLFVSRTAVVNVNPDGPRAGRDLLGLARGLRVEWSPREATR